MLGKIVSSHQRDWDEVLPHVLTADRALQPDATGFSSNLLGVGRESRSPLDLVYGRPPDAVDSAANYSTHVRDLGDGDYVPSEASNSDTGDSELGLTLSATDVCERPNSVDSVGSFNRG